MPEDHAAVLRNIVDTQPQLYLEEISAELQEITGVKYDDSTVWRVLTKRIKYSLQVVVDRAKQVDEQQREDYKNALHETVLFPDMAVFIDETAKDRNSARRRRHWSKRRKTPIRDSFFIGDDHRRRYSLLSACDVNGFIIEACELVEREYSPNDTSEMRGTIDKDRFMIWVEEYLVPVLGCYEKAEPRSVVILDNASIHHDDRVVEMIEAAGARVLYTAPYSPDLNPIEYMFGKYKAMLKRYTGGLNPQHWLTAHLNALLSISHQDAGSWFRHCNVPGCEHFLPVKEAYELESSQQTNTRTTVAAAAAVAVTAVALLLV